MNYQWCYTSWQLQTWIKNAVPADYSSVEIPPWQLSARPKNTALVDLYVNPIPDLVFLHDEVMGAYREIPLKTPSGTKTSDVIDSITKPNSSSIFGNRNMWRKPLWKRLYFSLASHLFMWGVVGFNSCSATVYIIQWVALKWKPVGSPTVQDSTCMPTVRGLTQNTRSKAL